ncbi:uncharacterized protein DNG_07164 [Cephalotrichum gorgonifer]|uniref:WW domain-containing protein n=1 Tax=Cephalotrichum gorgonifer TaxID=2041049 RepID=A0AAE8N2X2_9PEZI|nr:uncharacterized protein DNG_07164 [Cephalotrichum gorgonifer]
MASPEKPTSEAPPPELTEDPTAKEEEAPEKTLATDHPEPTDTTEKAAASEEPAGPREEESEALSRSSSESREQGEVSEPPLPDEAPPLPAEPAPGTAPEDDGWDYRWDYPTGRYIFFNRITGEETLENPRVAVSSDPAATTATSAPEPPIITGYNPAIHGDYDPDAWYARPAEHQDTAAAGVVAYDPTDPAEAYEASALFNRFTGQYQTEGPGRHSDEAKSRRQMNAYFDVDAAANSHDGRSLKAERAGKKPSKNELKAFKEKRRARKEEKRRAWLRD